MLYYSTDATLVENLHPLMIVAASIYFLKVSLAYYRSTFIIIG